MKLPKVSFVICTLNCKDFTERAIKSIRKQDYPKNKIEVIIVDSYSTDGTIEVARKLGARVILTKVKGYPEGKGMPKSIGCDAAKGDIVVTIDSDNALVEKDWITKMIYPLMNDKTIAYAICRMAVVKSDNLTNQYLSYVGTDPFAMYGSLDPQISLGRARLVDKGKYYVRHNTKDDFLLTGGYYLTLWKKTLKSIGGYSRDVDVAYLLASRPNGANIAIVKDAHLHHLMTPGARDFLKKKVKWGRYYFVRGATHDRVFKWSQGMWGRFGKVNFVYQVIKDLLFVPALVESIPPLIKYKDKAWLLHAPLVWATTVAYIWAFTKAKLNIS
ncbi:glycosyltransferase family 2 protein [Candidatus Pacearchaeota archaeon]|nr:glycosyltransferase family 2 protein [Candidatus Pacearchaeota archaeon]